MKVIFSHGKESGPWGSKITQLANVAKDLGLDVDSIDYTGLTNADKRVLKLSTYIKKETEPYILVGSSMGGYVSLVCAKATKPTAVFLLAPALFMPDYAQQVYDNNISNIEIVHGWSDDVIPVEHSIKYAQQAQCTLHLIDGDHRLNTSLTTIVNLFKLFLQKIKQ